MLLGKKRLRQGRQQIRLAIRQHGSTTWLTSQKKLRKRQTNSFFDGKNR